jgi:hypothetical protein
MRMPENSWSKTMRIIMTAATAIIALYASAFAQEAAPKPGSKEQVITPQSVDRAGLAQLVGNPGVRQHR